VLARRFPVVPIRASTVLLHAVAATVIALVHILYWLGLMLWMRPYDRMTVAASDLHLGQILLVQLPLEWILYCLVLGCALALEFYQRYRERALEAAELQRALAQARLHALELQIQPHFLFNTLNAIAGLVRTQRADQAIRMIAGLADLLRYALDNAGRQRVRLSEEIEILRRYLEIQQLRFPDRMDFRIDVADEVRDAAVPVLILQPLAENAIRHGIALRAEGGHIELTARREGERLRICLHNSGALASGYVPGIGLGNTIERLRTLYGDGARFELSAHRDGVLAQLDLPWSDLP
jgi:two-component system, LytTR family, sensor kinase